MHAGATGQWSWWPRPLHPGLLSPWCTQCEPPHQHESSHCSCSHCAVWSGWSASPPSSGIFGSLCGALTEAVSEPRGLGPGYVGKCVAIVGAAGTDRPFSRLEMVTFCKVATIAELANTGPLPLREIQGEVAVSLRSRHRHQWTNMQPRFVWVSV